MIEYPQTLGAAHGDLSKVAERAEDEAKRPERLQRWNELCEQIGYKRTDALLCGVEPDGTLEQEFAELIPLAKKRKIW